MEDGKSGRRRMDEQSWRVVLEHFDIAATTVQEFCLREALTRSVFMRWRARLRPSSSRLPAPAVDGARALAPKPSIVDLGVLGASTAAAAKHAGLELRIELGGGLSVHLVRR